MLHGVSYDEKHYWICRFRASIKLSTLASSSEICICYVNLSSGGTFELMNL
jgi:hypothetical protein